MDPLSRRFLWNSIMSVIQDRRAVVLTSHRYYLLWVFDCVSILGSFFYAQILILSFFLSFQYGGMRGAVYPLSNYG